MAATTKPDAIVLEDLHRMECAKGSAAVLAIGTANPANCVSQDEFTDWYFRITKSNHLTKLKEKMKRICTESSDKSGIKKRYWHHTEDMIIRHPEFVDRTRPSLSARLSICAEAAAVVAVDAATSAIAEWGRPAEDITHLVVSTNSSGDHEPGVDLRVAGLLGLRPTAHRTLLNLHGCSSGFVALRVAKNLAENNRAARVLVLCSQFTLLSFCAPDDAQDAQTIVSSSIFGDGAGAVIVGAHPATSPIERPIFYLVSTSQVTLPGTEQAVRLDLSESGVDMFISVEVPTLVRDSIKQCLVDALAPLGLPNGGWNSLFWAVHPGGRAVLDSFEAALDLKPSKLASSRRVLSEYGNMSGTTIIFVLDDIRRQRPQDAVEEEGKRGEWGVMSGLGPGLTVETFVLCATGN